jgi:hypothetical protein
MLNNNTRPGHTTWSKQIHKDPLELAGRGSFIYVIILSDSPPYDNPSFLPKVPKLAQKHFSFHSIDEIFARKLSKSTQQEASFRVEGGFLYLVRRYSQFGDRSQLL